jgi:hypothetical protein
MAEIAAPAADADVSVQIGNVLERLSITNAAPFPPFRSSFHWHDAVEGAIPYVFRHSSPDTLRCDESPKFRSRIAF